MSTSRLHEDLLKDLIEEKKSIKEQIDLVDPLASSIHRPAYKRYIQSGFSVFLEIILWIIALGLIVFAFFYNKVFPFEKLKKIFDIGINNEWIGNGKNVTIQDTNAISWTIQALIIITAILLIIISRMLSNVRHKNNLLHLSAKNMKQLVELQLRRRAAIETLEQRYAAELPTTHESIELPPANPHNDTSFDDI